MEHVNENAAKTNATHTAHAAGRSRYVGPSAARIAELVAPRQRVRFERGWFWTAAFCHGTEQEQDLMAFRQRPDGDGIDVRCHRGAAQGMQSVNCSRERIIRSLEWLSGESIWSAYAAERWTAASSSSQSPADDSGGTGGTEGTGRRSWRVALLPFMTVVGVLVTASLILGFELEVAALSAVGYGWVGWLAHRAVVTHRRAASAAKGGRPR
ncbi:MAG: lysine exporter LysO family protein [Chloroflexi bacterium]|nr:lysine exporter LysO family protein [Chloroflexota bacterium]